MTEPDPNKPTRFVVYDVLSGEILRWGQCAAITVGHQPVEDGQAVLPLPPHITWATTDTHRVDVTEPADPQVVPLAEP